MKRIGLIGGLGWPSTLHYYEMICQRSEAWFKERQHPLPLPTPVIHVESLNLHQLRSLRPDLSLGNQKDWQAYDQFLHQAFKRLEDMGADVALMASNTPHQRMFSFKKGLKLKILSILECTAEKIESLGYQQAFLLGTSLTVNGQAYPDALAEKQVTCLNVKDQALGQRLDQLIDGDLFAGKIDYVRQELCKLAEQHAPKDQKTAVVLACTELPHAFPEHKNDAFFEYQGFAFVNPTSIHAQAAFDYAVEENDQGPF